MIFDLLVVATMIGQPPAAKPPVAKPPVAKAHPPRRSVSSEAAATAEVRAKHKKRRHAAWVARQSQVDAAMDTTKDLPSGFVGPPRSRWD